MIVRCKYGCIDPKTGRTAVHRSPRFCAPYMEMLKNNQVHRYGEQPGMTSPPPAQEARPLPEPKTGQGLNITFRPADVVSPVAATQAALELDWEVSQETAVNFWQTLFTGLEMVVNALCKFIQIPDMPQEVFILDEGQKFVVRTALRGFTTNVLKRVFRAKSPADADRIVAGLGGIIGFGMMFVKIITHFMVHVPNSPRIRAFRERRKKLLEEQAKLREMQRQPQSPQATLTVPVP